jgi:hypothetical protein
MSEPVLWQTIPGDSKNGWNASYEPIFSTMLQTYSGETTIVTIPGYRTAMNQQTADNLRRADGRQLLAPQTYSLLVTFPSNGQPHYQYAGNIGYKQPKDLTIHLMEGHYHSYDLHPLPYFPSAKRVTLIGAQQFVSYNIVNTMPQLTYLSFVLTTFTGFDLGLHLPATLTEFHFRHQDVARCYFNNRNIQLLQLSTLGLTPHEVNLFQRVNLPALRTFILYSPKTSPTQTTPLQISNDIYGFGRNIQQLEFPDWPNSSAFTTAGWTTASILQELLSRTIRLKKVKFIKSFVDGRELVEVLQSRILAEGMTGHRLLELTLDRCDGIKREHCEKIQTSDPSLVHCLKVFV